MDGPHPLLKGNQKQFSALVDGVPTEFVLTTFVDRIFILVTQSGKMGTLISASRDAPASSSYTIATLLGRRDDPVSTLLARQLIEAISSSSTAAGKPLLLGLGLLPRKAAQDDTKSPSAPVPAADGASDEKSSGTGSGSTLPVPSEAALGSTPNLAAVKQMLTLILQNATWS